MDIGQEVRSLEDVIGETLDFDRDVIWVVQDDGLVIDQDLED